LLSGLAKREALMLYFRYYLTLLLTQKGFRLNISPEPGIDLNWGRENGISEIWCWDQSFPLWLAEIIHQDFRSLLSEGTGLSFRRINRGIRKTTQRYNYSGTGRWIRLTECSSLQHSFYTSKDQVELYIEKYLPGRELTSAELVGALSRTGVAVNKNSLEFYLHQMILKGRVQRRAGIGLDEIGRFYCRRCGERERIHQEYLQAASFPCRVCPSCRNLGVLSDLTPLYHWLGNLPEAKGWSPPELVLPELTLWQSQAAERILDFWQKDSVHNTLLVWAVCGAGKTEVVFPVIQRALSQGKRVLLTVPRREVVKELSARIKRSFPGMSFTLLYGGKKQEQPGSLFMVATTHQLLRFSPYFHLVILDEADAFPFRDNPMLNAALNKVILPTGKKIYMTATPDGSWRRKASRSKIEIVRIPLRYHGHLLPVPTLLRSRLPSKSKWFIPKVLKVFLFNLREQNRKGLIFLPRVEQVEEFGKKLKSKDPNIDYIHSQDPLKEEKIKRFTSGSLSVLITTTLLERGLTFKHLDVMVLFADQQRVFSPETLVQIAGRVGRSAEDPDGRVWFVAETVSPAMKEARKWVLRMNMEARKMKYRSS
jgi:competence protein ComFA